MAVVPASWRRRRSPGVLLVTLMALLTACNGGGGGDASALPADLEAGRQVYGRHCAACHGSGGEGAVGPALDTVTETFRSCDEQMRWIALGSERWKREVDPTLGGREITGVMPPFEQVLTPAEIAQVSAYQRHGFGGESPEAALAACGLADAG